MRISFLIVITLLFALPVIAQDKAVKKSGLDKSKKVLLVEASCGQCKLGLPGKNCDLAIRLNGKSYFVDGTKIDDHGDAHAKDGFCEAIRMAKVQGEIKDDRFKATYFKLVPEVSTKEQ
jgi:hypothetical protein